MTRRNWLGIRSKQYCRRRALALLLTLTYNGETELLPSLVRPHDAVLSLSPCFSLFVSGLFLVRASSSSSSLGCFVGLDIGNDSASASFFLLSLPSLVPQFTLSRLNCCARLFFLHRMHTNCEFKYTSFVWLQLGVCVFSQNNSAASSLLLFAGVFQNGKKRCCSRKRFPALLGLRLGRERKKRWK